MKPMSTKRAIVQLISALIRDMEGGLYLVIDAAAKGFPVPVMLQKFTSEEIKAAQDALMAKSETTGT
jgi:hypothetical protein